MKVLVLGASKKPHRYSNMALKDLLSYGHEVLAVGNRIGTIEGVSIEKEVPDDAEIDTVTVYLSVANQVPYSDYLLNLNLKRIIFNPGAENPELGKKLSERGVEVLNACTLVMLRTNQFNRFAEDARL